MVKIAIPLTSNTLSEHFGHCDQFAVFELSKEGNAVASFEMLTPPPHEPGVFPAWLKSLGVTIVIAGGMGRRALDLFAQNGIAVYSGAPGATSDQVIKDYLSDSLGSDEPVCNHEHGHEHHCG